MGTVAILVKWPKLFEQTYIPQYQGDATWNLASTCQVVTEEKKFKNIESERLGLRSMNDLDLCYS